MIFALTLLLFDDNNLLRDKSVSIRWDRCDRSKFALSVKGNKYRARRASLATRNVNNPGVMYGRKVYIPEPDAKALYDRLRNASARRVLGEVNKLISRRGDDLNNVTSRRRAGRQRNCAAILFGTVRAGDKSPSE